MAVTTSSSFDFSLPYVNSYDDLRKEYRARERCGYRARSYFLKTFGFDVDDYSFDFSGGGMWRQFFGLHFENIVAEVLCRSYDLDRFDLTYLCDGFTTRNPFKYSLVMPKFARRKRGWEVRKYLVAEDFVERQCIADIKLCGSDEPAFNLHASIAERSGIKNRTTDISDFLADFVHHSLLHLNRESFGRIFDTLFVLREKNGRLLREKLGYDGETYKRNSHQISFKELEDLSAEKKVFPSAKTYYSQLYLFIPGIFASYAQIEAVFELADEAIYIPAAEGFRRCKEVIGFYPLVIPMPDFNLLEEFRFTKNPACVCMCSEIDFEFSPSGNFYLDCLNIGRKLLRDKT
ncbi:hypothetical protein [Archaeoglobus fulgidus]|uniref:hypothetical protein n=1 Tax=Archaeoglobus fulgidus TaxID=2234 RepID=UPI001177D308|nr:hypothetical protein [Archaeoglobus fulgidus]